MHGCRHHGGPRPRIRFYGMQGILLIDLSLVLALARPIRSLMSGVH